MAGRSRSSSPPRCSAKSSSASGLGRVLEPWAAEIVTKLNTCTEVSPSGEGLKLFARGKLPGSGKKRAQIEMYDQGRYFTVTGKHWPETPHVKADLPLRARGHQRT